MYGVGLLTGHDLAIAVRGGGAPDAPEEEERDEHQEPDAAAFTGDRGPGGASAIVNWMASAKIGN